MSSIEESFRIHAEDGLVVIGFRDPGHRGDEVHYCTVIDHNNDPEECHGPFFGCHGLHHIRCKAKDYLTSKGEP